MGKEMSYRVTVPNPNRVAVINEYPKLKKRFDIWKKLYRATHDSWPALFGTAKHKLRSARRDRMADWFCQEVRKEFGIKVWDVRMFHRQDGHVIVWREEE